MPIVNISKADLLKGIHRDCVLFFSFYLQDELTMEVPDFHEELWNELLDLLDKVNNPEMLVGTLQKLLAVPREHAKTTIIKLAVILFMRYSRLSFTAYISKTFANALNALRDIKDWLTSPQEAELYGPCVVEKSNETDGVFILQIGVPNKTEKKRIILKAFGWGTQIRGTLIFNKRPDFMVFDDIEDLDTLEPKTQSRLDNWVYGSAIRAMAKRGLAIMIGNMIAKTTLLARLAKDPAWNPTVFGALIRDVEGRLRALWRERWTVEALLTMYREYRRKGLGHIFEAEMMNLTTEDVLGESLSSAIRLPMPSPEDVRAGFICLDPAFGLKAYNDESAITVHVQLQGQPIPFVVQSLTGRFREEAIFDNMIELSQYWGLTTWVIEAVAAQRLLLPLFKTLSIIRGLPTDLFTYLPITGGKESKPSRIVAFRALVAGGSYGIVEEEETLVEKLEQYHGGVEHEDLEDSASLGSLAWATYGSVIESMGRQDVSGRILETFTVQNRSELQVCAY